MRSLRTHIRDAHLQIFRDLPLHVEVPGLNVGRSSAVARHQQDATVPILPFWYEWARRRQDVWEAVIDLERRAVADAQVLNIEKSQSILIGKGALF